MIFNLIQWGKTKGVELKKYEFDVDFDLTINGHITDCFLKITDKKENKVIAIVKDSCFSEFLYRLIDKGKYCIFNDYSKNNETFLILKHRFIYSYKDDIYNAEINISFSDLSFYKVMDYIKFLTDKKVKEWNIKHIKFVGIEQNVFVKNNYIIRKAKNIFCSGDFVNLIYSDCDKNNYFINYQISNIYSDGFDLVYKDKTVYIPIEKVLDIYKV